VTGIKAGVVAGVIYSIILAPFTYLTLILLREDIISMIMASLPEGSSLTAEEIFSFTLLIGLVSVFIAGIILGLIFGLRSYMVGGRWSSLLLWE